ncbi:MAG: MFS transporter [Candidatus Dormibacteria bacterium]
MAALDVQRFLGLGYGGFGAFLTAGTVAAFGGTVLAPRVASHLGARRGLAASLLLFAVLVTGAALSADRLSFSAGYIAAIGLTGVIDVLVNTPATAALGDRPGALTRFHALFNSGAVVGALLMVEVLALTGSWRLTWILVAALALTLALTVARGRSPDDSIASRPSGSARRSSLPRPLIWLAVVFALGALVEGGVESWGVLYLRSHLHLAAATGALAYATGQGLATVGRVFVGPRAGALGAARGAAFGAGFAALGLGLEATFPAPWALLGLAMAVVGVALCWPLLLAAGSAIGGESNAVVVSRLTSAGYVGILLGPVFVGAVSGGLGIRAGVYVLAGSALLVSLGAFSGSLMQSSQR